MALEFTVQLGNVDRPSVVKYGVESFQDALLRQVHLIDQEPVTLFYGRQQDTVAPPELYLILVILVGRYVSSVSIKKTGGACYGIL